MAFLAVCGIAARVDGGDPPVGPAGKAPTPEAGSRGRVVPRSPLRLSPDQARESLQWLVTLAAERMPDHFDGDDGWGDTKKIWAGVQFERDGFRLRTHRRYRHLKHGRWLRYRLTIPAGDRNAKSDHRFRVTVDSVSRDEPDGWRIETSLVAPLDFDVRVERWNLGLQWWSVNITGDARIRLKSVATVGFLADYADVPPALAVDPKVEWAKLELEHFEVERVSKVGGDFAEGFGEVVEEALEELWIDRENRRLADRINRKLSEHRDDLRWSLADWLRSWNTP